MDEIQDLGWANGWSDKPEEVKKCEELGHRMNSMNCDPSHHGLDTLFYCSICKIQYHVDSSD